jgi:preprotein translocase subunit SecF
MELFFEEVLAVKGVRGFLVKLFDLGMDVTGGNKIRFNYNNGVDLLAGTLEQLVGFL